jgi:hypothetical protein
MSNPESRGQPKLELLVTQGQQVFLSAVGTWTVGYPGLSFVSADGYLPDEDMRIFQGCKLDSMLPYGKLLARVGDNPSFWVVGSDGVFTADRDGVLAFRIHDADACLVDNAGQ